MAELKFSVDSALLSELGEKLVESSHIALVELVKNAYDADATWVTVKIGWKPTGAFIEVTDNGVGMTLADVRKYWMRIATTHKSGTLSSRYGRPRTGSKGIGRFACRRLGTTLFLETIAAWNGAFEKTSVSFPWAQFKPGGDVTKVIRKGERRKLTTAQTGTTLVITGGPEDLWDRRGFNFLKRQLAVLTANRGRKVEGFEEDPGFNVSLIAPGIDGSIENLRDELISAGWGDINLEIDESGTVQCVLRAQKIGRRVITYPTKMPHLFGVSAKIGIMPAEKGEFRRTDVLSKSSLKQIIDNWGGVFVRYQGFRVYPYGEPPNDWLRIDRDRGTRRSALPTMLQPFAAKLRGVDPGRALLSLLSSRAYVGDVEISGPATEYFEPKASREGFLDSETMRDLTAVVRFAIDWSTLYREYARSLAAREEADKAREDLEDKLGQGVTPSDVVTSALRVVETQVQSLAKQLPVTERQEVLRSLRTATNAIAKHEASSLEERRHLQLVASTSTLVLIFSHEVKTLLSWFEQIRISLNRIEERVGGSEAKQLSTIAEEFGATKDRLLELLSMTSLISTPRKAKPARLTLLPRLLSAIRSFELILNSYDIHIDTRSVSKTLQVGPMLEAELFAILLNLLSNSIKSVIAAPGKRVIEVSSESVKSMTIIHFRDTGVGLAENYFEAVFTPFSSDPANKLYDGLDRRMNPEDEYIVGTGSGLGLSIVREILAYRGGSIRFIPPSHQWKAHVELTIP